VLAERCKVVAFREGRSFVLECIHLVISSKGLGFKAHGYLQAPHSFEI
jgi:hypothetical protein